MKVKNEDLILYLIHLIKNSDTKVKTLNKEDISRALCIKLSSVNVYLSKLSTSGLIEREKKHFIEDIISTISITDRGNTRVQALLAEIDNIYFTPERHMIPGCVSYENVSQKMKDPLDRAFLLSLYYKKHSFDIVEYLSSLNIIHDDSKVTNFFMTLDGKKDESPFICDIYNMSLYGDTKYSDIKLGSDLKPQEINGLLIKAETLLKQGKLSDARMLYEMLESPNINVSQNQWFLIKLGLANVYRKSEDLDKAMQIIDDLDQQTDIKVYLSYAKQLKALELGFRGKYDESMKYFTSAIRSFHNFGFPLLLNNVYGNRGVIYFINKKYELAEKDWKTAKKYAIKGKSKYAEAKCIVNLADVELLRGNFEATEKYLKEGDEIFMMLEDFEGVALIDYNWGFYYLATGDKKKAIEKFHQFLKRAEPLAGPYMEGFYRKEFLDRGKKYGIIDLEKFI